MAIRLFDTSGLGSVAEAAEDARRRGLGRLGGLLFLFGALVAIPSAIALDDAPHGTLYALIAFALASGIVCFAVPWDRLAPTWLNAVPLTAALVVTIGVFAADTRGIVHWWLYGLIAIFVAYAFRSRIAVAAYALFLALCMATPIADPYVATSDLVGDLIVSVPGLFATMALVAYLRERLEASRSEFHELARRDPLTGVGNYRTLHERLEYETARHARHGRLFALLLLDLDSFKNVNEAHGHLEGDRVLRDVGQALAATMREQDTLARQGGDEFSVLAPETGPEEVPTLAHRLQRAVAEVVVDDAPLTVSIGWAVFPTDGETAEALLVAADAALRSTKQAELGGVREDRHRAGGHLRSVGGGSAAASSP
jgi:diguanylate cyclase (GGDEF)-like protein